MTAAVAHRGPLDEVSSLRDLHVVMLLQYLPLHFVSTMQAFAARVGRLTLLLSERMDSSRDWEADFASLDVKIQRSLGIPIKHRHPLGFEDAGQLLIPYTTFSDLLRMRPDVVVSNEIGARTIQAALLRSLGARFKLIIQVRESENTARSRGRVRRAVRRFVLPRADGVFVNGATGLRYVATCGVGRDRIHVVPSGTDTTTFGRDRRAHVGYPELRLLYVGQLISRKGLVPFANELAATAARTKRAIRWTVVGRGPLEKEITAVATPPNLHFELLGPRPYRDLPALYADADIFTMPSLSDEWGLVVNEAMASGLPILGSTGAQAVEELVTDRESGWIYDPLKVLALRRALEAAVTACPEALARMGEYAHARAIEISDHYASKSMAAGIAKTLNRCASSSAAVGGARSLE